MKIDSNLWRKKKHEKLNSLTVFRKCLLHFMHRNPSSEMSKKFPTKPFISLYSKPTSDEHAGTQNILGTFFNYCKLENELRASIFKS